MLATKPGHPNAMRHACNCTRPKDARLKARLHDNLALVDNHLLVDPRLCVTPFKPFIGLYPRLIHIDVENSDTTMIAIIPAIASETSCAAIAHPDRWLLSIIATRNAVVIDVVTVANQYSL